MRAKQSNCFNCHAIEQQIVGSPLLKIAGKKWQNMDSFACQTV